MKKVGKKFPKYVITPNVVKLDIKNPSTNWYKRLLIQNFDYQLHLSWTTTPWTTTPLVRFSS
jgi:hypothetical protein